VVVVVVVVVAVVVVELLHLPLNAESDFPYQVNPLGNH